MHEGWQQGKILDFFELQRGFDLTEKQISPGSIPVYSSSGIAYHHNRYMSEGPGVIIGRKGSVGSVHYSETSYWPHDTTLWVRDFKGNDAGYVWYFLQSLNLVRFDEASSIPTLNRNNVHRQKCVFPCASLQKRIVQILRSWDEAIETTERLIAAKERRLDALADRLLFGNRRLGGRQTNELNHCRWFNFPDDWKCPHIGEVAEQSSLRNAGGVQIPVLSCTKYDGLVDSLTYFGRQIFSEDTSNYRVVRCGEFAYATNHLEEGSIGYLDFLDAGLISPMYTVFRTDSALVDDRFVLKVFKTKTFLHIFRANTSSSVDRRGGLRWEDFARIRIPLPGKDEQVEIDAVLTHARREADLHRKQLAQLQRQKHGLMQKLLTGEWPVPLLDGEVDDLAERVATGEAA